MRLLWNPFYYYFSFLNFHNLYGDFVCVLNTIPEYLRPLDDTYRERIIEYIGHSYEMEIID